MLKIKSLIYRYIGIYLATREEQVYMQSDEAKKYVKQFTEEFDNEEAAIGLVVGSWQVQHGFTRPMSVLRFKEPQWFWDIVAHWHESIIAIKWDLKK